MSTFKRMTRADLVRTYPSKVQVTEQSISIAREVTASLWNERCLERGMQPSADRSGSCKFAALIAREIFGGRIAGNDEHVFVILAGSIIDLNDDQEDVKALGAAAHLDHSMILAHPDYRDALGSCMPRASKWAQVALTELGAEAPRLCPQKSLLEATISP